MEKKKGKNNVLPTKEKLRNEVITTMTEMKLWNEELIVEIPTYWDSFNNFVIFNSKFFKHKNWISAGLKLWECVSKVFGGRSIGLQGKIQNDDFRSPSAKVVYGVSPWVEYLDNGIMYTWNIESTMFCSGNVSERHRIASLNCQDQVVVDMFAGIGYFSLPYLIHSKAKHLVACEWNPVSVEALNLNLCKNGVSSRCDVRAGDVRITRPVGVADHINMGLIPSCEQYWPVAAEILRPSGGILHVHGNVTTTPKLDHFAVQCEKCLNVIQKLSLDMSCFEISTCINFEIIITAANLMEARPTGKESVKWKRIEWFVWTVHVSHSFSEHLYAVSKAGWTVTPVFLHRIKAYAPHIDHLVVDVSCKSK